MELTAFLTFLNAFTSLQRSIGSYTDDDEQIRIVPSIFYFIVFFSSLGEDNESSDNSDLGESLCSTAFSPYFFKLLHFFGVLFRNAESLQFYCSSFVSAMLPLVLEF
ncbi:hypothetical protein POVWA1_085250 [Plasmodium ovale wallikeri]|uniref:Uncharacterized protein n=1 Tax=Plasmodium ovale wallikeri TaxID=864142 RepID=A0A1A9AP82_PLAOA|nr:hypothetical protein POVWA1_085250 [Plasmodium ovale wallikeri]